MAQNLSLVLMLALAGVFGWGVPLLRLFDTFQPLTTALAIIVAAVFVRLNRGMPTLEWKSVDIQERKRLTSAIVDVAQEYAWIVAIDGVLLATLVILTTVGKPSVTAWPDWAQRLCSAALGGGIGLSIARMMYVVWRDLDIVKLQKRLIDISGVREALVVEQKAASEKVANIRSAAIRRGGVTEPKPWGE